MIRIIEQEKTDTFNNIRIVKEEDGYSVVLLTLADEEVYLEEGLTKGRAIATVIQLEPVVTDNEVHTIIINEERRHKQGWTIKRK